MEPALFCMPLLPVLKRTRAEFEPRGVEAFAYVDEIRIGIMEVPADTVEVLPFPQREQLPNIGNQPTRAKRLPCPRRVTYLRRNKSPFLKVLKSASRNGMG